MKYGFFGFVHDAYRKSPRVVNADLTGKTVVIVGANTGIGLEATLHFASMKPAKIIMACRNIDKGNAAKAKVERETLYKSAEVWLLDLSNFSSVIAFADKFEKEGGRLDIVVANAAVAVFRRDVSPDGWESTLQVNYLSTAMLSLLLLPAMERTAKAHSTAPRLVIVSSSMHYWTSITDDVRKSPNILEKLNDEKYCTPSVMADRYSVSKLLEVFFTRALNDHLGTSPVVVDVVCPGFCYSELRREPEYSSLFNRIFEWLFAQTAEEGSRNLVYAAIGGKDADLRGEFVANSKLQEISDFALSAEGSEVQGRLWDELIEILSKASPKISGIVDEHLTPSARSQ
ncbi:hypothetical protein PLICRDRAFT_134861 [Plicaturopsis crispa FD-325 SS-3]|nr:hypothetical protein PLICRDRAFT_134861 [Plicaturopsis crispa FD-325 SS-3]